MIKFCLIFQVIKFSSFLERLTCQALKLPISIGMGDHMTRQTCRCITMGSRLQILSPTIEEIVDIYIWRNIIHYISFPPKLHLKPDLHPIDDIAIFFLFKSLQCLEKIIVLDFTDTKFFMREIF